MKNLRLDSVIIEVFEFGDEIDTFKVKNVMDVPEQMKKRGYILEPVHYFTLGVGETVKKNEFEYKITKIMKAV